MSTRLYFLELEMARRQPGVGLRKCALVYGSAGFSQDTPGAYVYATTGFFDAYARRGRVRGRPLRLVVRVQRLRMASRLSDA
ncbi:MAG: hypothetical protein R3C10_03290 [Pirellulales bacterium]